MLKPLQILMKGEHTYAKSTTQEGNPHAEC